MCQLCVDSADPKYANWTGTPGGEYRDPRTEILSIAAVPTYHYTDAENEFTREEASNQFDDSRSVGADHTITVVRTDSVVLLNGHMNALGRHALIMYRHLDPCEHRIPIGVGLPGAILGGRFLVRTVDGKRKNLPFRPDDPDYHGTPPIEVTYAYFNIDMSQKLIYFRGFRDVISIRADHTANPDKFERFPGPGREGYKIPPEYLYHPMYLT